jgi:hypothetical protein
MIIRDPHDEQRYTIHDPPTINVIERPAESYDAYHERKKKEERDGEPKRVPFGFGRVLEEDS